MYIWLLVIVCNLVLDAWNLTCSYAQEWQEMKGEHFIVYFTQNEDFSKDVLNRAENYYQNIATGLGYPRYKEFWLWDKRVKIYLYPDSKSYLAETGQPEWSSGMADYQKKAIASYIGSQVFLLSVLPHEIAHLIFRDFVGFKSEIPLWLDEGVAQWAEEARKDQIRRMVKELYNKDSLLVIEDMMHLDMRLLKEGDRIFMRSSRSKSGEVGVLFLTTKVLVDTCYIESFSLVSFLIEKYGSYAFAAFCRNLRDGMPVEDSLKSAYPEYIHNLKEFEQRWRKYLLEEGS